MQLPPPCSLNRCASLRDKWLRSSPPPRKPSCPKTYENWPTCWWPEPQHRRLPADLPVGGEERSARNFLSGLEKCPKLNFSGGFHQSDKKKTDDKNIIFLVQSAWEGKELSSRGSGPPLPSKGGGRGRTPLYNTYLTPWDAVTRNFK